MLLQYRSGGLICVVSYWRFGQSRFDQFCQTEIQNLRMAIARDHDVVGLQIAVDDPGSMSFCQSFGRVLQKSQKLSQFRMFTMNLLAQRLAIDELHRDEVRAIGFTNLVDVRDVRMIEGRGRLCLANEAFHPFAIRGNLGRQKLQRNFTIEFCVLRQINLTHSARTDFGKDAIVGQIKAGG